MNKTIEQVIGGDYMKFMTYIFGDLGSIEETVWMKQNARITVLLNEIPVKYRSRLVKIPPFNQPKIARKKNKPNKLQYNDDCRHEIVIRSDFFKGIRADLASINKLIENAYDGKEFFSHARWNGEVPDSDLIVYRDKIAEIVDILLTPSYDVRMKIVKNQGIIQDIFKNKAVPKELGLAEIIDIIENFAIVEYRCRLLNDANGYMKIFMKTFQDSSLAKMKGSNFTAFIDSIDFDKIENKETLKTFAMGARKIFEKAEHGEKLDKEVLEEIRSLLEHPVGSGAKDEDGVEF